MPIVQILNGPNKDRHFPINGGEMVGRDPAKGTIIPLFAPPENFSPAAVRFVARMGFDQKAFAAAVVNMAVKGYLSITENSDGDFTLSLDGADRAALSFGERRLADKLFGGATTVA